MARLRFVGGQDHVASTLVSQVHMQLGWYASQRVVTAVLLRAVAGCKEQALEKVRSEVDLRLVDGLVSHGACT